MGSTKRRLYASEDCAWRDVDEVEYATLEWVHWFNNRRLIEPIGDNPPVEYEELYCQNEAQATVAGVKPKKFSGETGAIHIRGW